MGKEYPADIVLQAEELYCVDRMTFAAVAGRLGLAASTLKRWATKYDWQKKRNDIQRARSEIRTDLIELRAKQIKHCITSMGKGGKGHAMNVFAAAKLEELALAAHKHAIEEEQLTKPTPIQASPITTPEEAKSALYDAVVGKIAVMLNDPSRLDLKSLKDLRGALDYLQPMETGARKKGISAETAQEIINKVLGG